jgi:hypothetical protein
MCNAVWSYIMRPTQQHCIAGRNRLQAGWLAAQSLRPVYGRRPCFRFGPVFCISTRRANNWSELKVPDPNTKYEFSRHSRSNFGAFRSGLMFRSSLRLAFVPSEPQPWYSNEQKLLPMNRTRDGSCKASCILYKCVAQSTEVYCKNQTNENLRIDQFSRSCKQAIWTGVG